MLLTVEHYRIRRGVRLLDAESSDWRDALRGCPADQVENVLDVLRSSMASPFNVTPVTRREMETLRYYGFYETSGEVWLELLDQAPAHKVVPMAPPAI